MHISSSTIAIASTIAQTQASANPSFGQPSGDDFAPASPSAASTSASVKASAATSLLAPATASALFQATQADNDTPVEAGAEATVSRGGSEAAVSSSSNATSTASENDPLSNLTSSDISLIEATLGVKQVTVANPSGASNTLVQLQNSQGQNIDLSQTFLQFNQLSLDISIGRTNGSITGNITASDFAQIADQSSGGSGLTTAEIAAGQAWLASQASEAA